MTGYSVYLYGSSARNEQAIHSDTDILVLFKAPKPNLEDFQGLSELDLVEASVDLSYYSLKRITEMYREGHLFAWHLYKEAKFLSGADDILDDIGEPEPYSNLYDDVYPLVELMKSSRDRLMASPINLVFEAGLLFVSARNIAMSSSYFSNEGVTFSAFAPLIVSNFQKPFPISKFDYETLRSARLASVRGLSSPQLNVDWVLSVGAKLIDWAEVVVDDYKECGYEASFC